MFRPRRPDSAPSPVRRHTRRAFLTATGAALGTALGVPAAAQSETATRVALEPVAEGFTSPVGVEFAPGDDRYFVVDQPGRVYAVGEERTTFLDVTDRTVDVRGYSEQGLLGLAFHPEYPSNRKLYVRYSAPPRAGTPSGWSHTFVLAEFTARADGSGVVADSERPLLEVPQPQSNHNAGAVAFGPEGYLYVGAGDGGAGGDAGTGHVGDWYDANAGGNGQDVTRNLLGSVLRIDVDDRDESAPYAVPDDNPLVGREGLDEHWAWGFRNPWRFSFDGDDLFVADVGQNQYEEVDLVERGGNYGWNVREGSHCFGADDCPTETPDGDPLREPILEYDHDTGIAVVGGYRYRGDAVPSLEGAYVFGDWRGSGSHRGALFAARPDGGAWSMDELVVADTASGAPERFVLGFGRDPAGELYVATSEEGQVAGSTGAIYRLAAPETTTEQTTANTTADSGVAGLGAGAALAGVAGAAGYLLGRSESEER